jgi:hypothetical protein
LERGDPTLASDRLALSQGLLPATVELEDTIVVEPKPLADGPFDCVTVTLTTFGPSEFQRTWI